MTSCLAWFIPNLFDLEKNTTTRIAMPEESQIDFLGIERIWARMKFVFSITKFMQKKARKQKHIHMDLFRRFIAIASLNMKRKKDEPFSCVAWLICSAHGCQMNGLKKFLRHVREHRSIHIYFSLKIQRDTWLWLVNFQLKLICGMEPQLQHQMKISFGEAHGIHLWALSRY